MVYQSTYASPLGKITIVSDGENIVGLYLEGQKYFMSRIKEEPILKDDLEIIKKTKEWLTSYFNGENPQLSCLSLSLKGTPFQEAVWRLLLDIPYGSVTTYKDLAIKVAKDMNIEKMSNRAVGSAVGHNPISIIVPCHRVVGVNGNLTGYAGGIDKKIKLLELENVNMEGFYITRKEKKEMTLEQFSCIHENINLEEYIEARDKVRKNMTFPDWLGDFSKEDLNELLANQAKIWMYYNKEEVVCSMMMIPSKREDLIKFGLDLPYQEVADYGPIFVNSKYRGNHLQLQMLKVLDNYCIKNGYQYVISTIHPDNKYSIHNFLTSGFMQKGTKEFKRGRRNIYYKKLSQNSDS